MDISGHPRMAVVRPREHLMNTWRPRVACENHGRPPSDGGYGVRMPLTKDLIDAAVERYSREADRYEKLARVVGKACRTLMENNGIRGAVQFRTKAADRLREKLHKYLRS